MLRLLGPNARTLCRCAMLSSCRHSQRRALSLLNHRHHTIAVGHNKFLTRNAQILFIYARELIDNWILLARKVSSPKSTGPIRHEPGSAAGAVDDDNRRIRRKMGIKADEKAKKGQKPAGEEFDVQEEMRKRMMEGRPLGFAEFMEMMKKQSQVFNQKQRESEEEDEKRGKRKKAEKEEEEGKDREKEEAKKEFIKTFFDPKIHALAFVTALFGAPLILLYFNKKRQQPGDPESSAIHPPSSTSLHVVSWNDFIEHIVPTGKVRNFRIQVVPEGDHRKKTGDKAVVEVAPGTKGADGFMLSRYFYVNVPDVHRLEQEIRRAETAAGVPPENWINIQWKEPSKSAFIIASLLLGALLFGPLLLFGRMLKKGGLGGMKLTESISEMMGGNKWRIYDPASKDGKLKIKFRDVAGLHEAKVEISEFVDYLRRPQKYTRLGAKLPKGAILTGPPGCGKTLLAKALAAESSVPFININGTEFVEMIGGLGASRIRQLFKAAKSRAPCIIYIDEIDAIGRKRDQSGRVDHSEEEQTLNQLLVEMDGMDTAKGVVVIGSTNRPDILDKALLRPGRFDRHISVDLPTLLERKEMFELYLRKIKRENRLTGISHRLAQMTPGFSGADIANVVNEAAIHAATTQKRMVFMEDLDYALQKIIAGPEKRSRTLVKEEREVVAFHESGHALVGWLLEHTEALLKVTIIPRTSAALGFAQYSPKDRKLFTREELFDRICMMLGGRAAENVAFGRITTGAQNDLEKVTKQAKAMVTWHGMSDVLGPISFFPGPGVDPRSADFQEKPYSRKLANLIDQEVSRLVSEAYFFTEKLLKDNKQKLDKLAHALLEKETLNYEDVKRLIGPPKFGDKNVVDLADDVLPDLTKEGR